MGRNRGKKKVPSLLSTQQLCLYCNVPVPNDDASQDVHYEGRRHKQLQKVYLYETFFKKQGLLWMDGKKEFMCVVHGTIGIPATFKSLQEHLNGRHNGMVCPIRQYDINVTPGVYSSAMAPRLLPVIQLERPKTYWVTEFNLDSVAHTYQEVIPPTLVVEGSNIDKLLLAAVNGGFNIDQLQFITEELHYLEENGDLTKRGELLSGTRMCSFGVRYAYNQLGWFKHENHNCYMRSERLAEVLSRHLEHLFPSIFQHLHDIRANEKMPNGIGCIGNTPFTAMSITNNYNCNVHDDKYDYSFGFIIWFRVNGRTNCNGNGVKFYLPDVGLFLEPNIGDIVMFKGKDIQHCTKTIGDCGQLGVALYQKSSFFRWYNKVQEGISEGRHDKFINSWLQSNKEHDAYRC